MSDIEGNAITLIAAKDIPKAIEEFGVTASKQQVGKALEITDKGVVLPTGDNTKFVGIVKAASADSISHYALSKMVDGALIKHDDAYVAPYYDAGVTIPAGKALAVERNCMSYVLMEDNTAKVGDLIGLSTTQPGAFKVETDPTKVVGRVYSEPSAYNIVKAYIKAI